MSAVNKIKKGSRDLEPQELVDMHAKVLEMNENGMKPTKISNELNFKQRTIETWIYQGYDPKNRFNCFDLSPTPELAYFIGVILGDGSVYSFFNSYTQRPNFIVKLDAIDEDFVRAVRKVIEKIAFFDLPKVYNYENDYGNVYRIVFQSTQFFQYIKRYEYGTTIFSFPQRFLGGMFDSDGWIRRDGHRIRFFSTSKNITDLVEILLKDLGIKTSRGTDNRGLPDKVVNNINIYDKESRKLFFENIGFRIQRKQKRLREGLGVD